MDIISITDLHGSSAGLRHIARELTAADVVLVTGDITHFGPREWAEEFMNSIPIPAIAVNGNCDTHDVVELLDERDYGLLDSSRDIGGFSFLGLGYPFYKGFEPEKKPDVILCHVPPNGCNDSVPGPGNIGDPNFREFIIKHRPRLVLSGHVHESPGITELENMVCVNPGPAKDRRGAVIEIDRDIVQARLVHI